jgi:serine/threonine-protein kinase RsbW/non-specific serine/threonine protein kinase
MSQSKLPERRCPAEGVMSPVELEALPSCQAPARLRWCEFVSPSTLQLAPLLDRLLEPIACPEVRSRLRLGLQEVLVNAVCHGNNRDPSLALRIRRIECDRWWVFQVQDQGSGVPPGRRLGCLPRDPAVSAGRGLFLIHHCFDDVRWSNRGNRLQVAVQR